MLNTIYKWHSSRGGVKQRFGSMFDLEQRFSNFFEVRTTFIGENSSAEHLTLVSFENKFINFVAYFNTSIFRTFCY